MEYRNLGRTDLRVSALCLGSMTWGEQNTAAEAHAQLDRAVEAGVNFIDTAEMYAFPASERTSGESERIIGAWLARRGRRDDMVIATKIVGPGRPAWIRDGVSRLDRANIESALDASLRRLGTDYVDLYQLHWPERASNYFGKLGYEPDPDDDPVPVEVTLNALADVVRSGKIRHVGVSNETPWGVMTWLRLAAVEDGPRIASIQNPYSLLNRSFEVGLAEVAHRESVGLLAYSPLAFGMLTGKHANGAVAPGSRLERWPEFRRYRTEAGQAAAAAYVALAREHGLSPAQMALAFAHSRPFTTSVILGATSVEQLEENLASAQLSLAPQVLEGIEAIQTRHPNPCP